MKSQLQINLKILFKTYNTRTRSKFNAQNPFANESIEFRKESDVEYAVSVEVLALASQSLILVLFNHNFAEKL